MYNFKIFILVPFLFLFSCGTKNPVIPVPQPPQNANLPVTISYDNSRTNADLTEIILNQTNVGSSNFGKVGSFAVDGFVYAQPLVVNTSNKNILLVVTMHNSIFAFDADSPGTNPIWMVNVGPSAPVTSVDTDFISKEVGCLATPVVDTNSQIVYASCTDATGNWKLYSFHLTDGTTYLPPVTYSGSYTGISFNMATQNQRPGLLLSNGQIYVAFGSYSDYGIYHGWIMAYNATTLAQTAIWCDTASSAGRQGGIWMSGGGLVSDASGNIYVETGNGDWNGTTDFGDSFVKLSPSLQILGYMTPTNQATLDSEDLDLGSSYPMIIGPFVMGTGKDGRWWIMNQINLNDITQMVPTCTKGVFGGQVFANDNLYLGCNNGHIQRYSWNGATLSTTALAQFTSSFLFPGAELTYSSNNDRTGTDVLWAATYPTGILHAFIPSNLAEIYNSTTNPNDAVGPFIKFVLPRVANGKVYVAAVNIVSVYGLK